MKSIVTKLLTVQNQIKEIKNDKMKRAKVGTILTILIVPIFLIMLKCAISTAICLLVGHFHIDFFLNLIAVCLLTLILTTIIMTVLYLNNVIEGE